MISAISNMLIPCLVCGIILYGVRHKVDVYYAFIEGAKESFPMIKSMFPTFLGMIFGINLFLNSGILEFLLNFLNPFLEFLKIPLDIVPMAVLRPISGSSTLAILNHIFEVSGPDSFIGRLASIIQGSTDTTFYIITLYFGCVGIKKIKYALWAGLFADLIGITASLIIVQLLF